MDNNQDVYLRFIGNFHFNTCFNTVNNLFLYFGPLALCFHEVYVERQMVLMPGIGANVLVLNADRYCVPICSFGIVHDIVVVISGHIPVLLNRFCINA